MYFFTFTLGISLTLLAQALYLHSGDYVVGAVVFAVIGFWAAAFIEA